MKFFAFRKNVLFGLEFMVLAGMLVAASLLAFWSFRTIQQTSTQVEQAFEVRDTLGELLSALQDAETAHNTYLLTGQDHYLRPHQAASEIATSIVARLTVLLEGSSNQLQQLDKLRPLIYDELASYARTLSLKKAGDERKLKAALLTDQSRMLQAELRDRVDSLRQEATRELAERQRTSTANVAVARRVLASLLMGSGAVAIFVWFLLIRLKNLERFVTICAWSKTIRHEGEWISFEEYLKQRYQVKVSHGISDTEFKTRMEQIDN